MIVYIQASFAVHLEYNICIRICTTLVHGSMSSLASKQKNNTKSSTRDGLIGVVNTVTFFILMKHCVVSQVRSININVQYFCIVDQLMTGDTSKVFYKPTEIMENDCFTQALQENLFHTIMMGLMNIFLPKV